MPSPPRHDVYISADVETDGPVPGPYSMLSFGLVVAGTYDGERFERAPADAPTLYRELAPISPAFESEALEVNGLDRERLVLEGTAPPLAMAAALEWVEHVAGDGRAVLVAYPVAFDWSFLYWYFVRFASRSPFGHASCLDIRTLYQAGAQTVFDLSSKREMPRELVPSRAHTHNALDDALEQAELFCNVFEWVQAERGAERVRATRQ
jgi:DNA polymerase III epsilon subunit-like protein